MKKGISQLRVGVLLNYINMGIGTLIPIFYTPIMLKFLGQTEYGLFKLSSSVTSYLSLISLGLGSAITRYLIKAMTESGKEEEERVLGLFVVIFQVIAVISMVAGLIIMQFLPVWYNASLDAEQLHRMTIIVFLLVCNMALNFSVSPFISLVTTHEKFIFLQCMNIVTTCIGPLLNLVILFLGFASIGMALASLIVSIFTRVCYFVYIRKKIQIRPVFKNLPFFLLREIMEFSLWIFVANIVGQLYNATDTVMIGTVAVLGTTGVAVYNVGTTFSTLTQTITIGVSSLLAPKTNKMVFSGATNEELTTLAIKVGRIQGYIVTLIISGFISFGRPFIYFYAGQEYSDAYWVGIFTMVHSMVPLVQSVCLNVLVAQNRHRFRSLTYLGIAVLNVIGTWFLMNTSLGIIGAALMTGIAGVIGTWFIMNWYYAVKIKLQIRRFWKNLLPLYIVPTILTCGTLILSQLINMYSINVLFTGIVLYTLAFVALSWTFIMNQYEKKLIAGPLYKVIRK